ncbi:MAG: hypothetical protein FWG39_04045 [Alphaproteobacteria bacterium]|nr:hypothetical protein [Alphaproteobacteria bacterium]
MREQDVRQTTVKALVDSGAWPLYRFNPMLIEQGENPLTMDSAGASAEQFGEFLKTEGRFNTANAMNPTRFARLVERAESDNEYRRELKKHIASFAILRKTPKSNQG